MCIRDRTCAVLGALGFRPAQVPAPLAVALAAGVRDGPTLRLDLAPLSADAARTLIADRVSGAQGDLLYRQSGGNPFFLLQLARGVTLTDVGSGLSDAVPETVRAAL